MGLDLHRGPQTGRDATHAVADMSSEEIITPLRSCRGGRGSVSAGAGRVFAEERQRLPSWPQRHSVARQAADDTRRL